MVLNPIHPLPIRFPKYLSVTLFSIALFSLSNHSAILASCSNNPLSFNYVWVVFNKVVPVNYIYYFTLL